MLKSATAPAATSRVAAVVWPNSPLSDLNPVCCFSDVAAFAEPKAGNFFASLVLCLQHEEFAGSGFSRQLGGIAEGERNEPHLRPFP